MVTVVKTPQGHKIIDQNITASIIEDYVGDAIVQFPYHGLGTGDYVYIESDIDEYNGFWYVTAVDANQFKISEHSEADFVEYYQDADIDYYQTQEHDWSSIFLPIVYKITNTFWPTNSEDAIRTVLSFSDDNGFTNLVLSGALRGSFRALEFVKVGDEVYQIVEVISASEIVINLPYSSSLTFSTVQYYYNNYQTRVKIYAGLPASHPWEPKKPFTEVAELSLTPDENNEVMFSVSDYITQKVAIKNNTLLFSLPLNLDAFTAFYISEGESYDQSDSYSLYTEESTFINDDFVGYAIAGKLPFKNMYSGDYADYVYTSGSPALWLTLFDRLLAVNGLYFDVSFIKNVDGPFHVVINKYISSDYFITESIAFEDFGIGVYRIPLEISSTYESYCLYVSVDEHDEEVYIPPNSFDLSLFENESGQPWELGDQPEWDGTGGSGLIKYDFAATAGAYNFHYKVNVIDTGGISFILNFALRNSGTLDTDLHSIAISSIGIYEGDFTITATGVRDEFVMSISASNFLHYRNVILMEITEGEGSYETVTIPAATITEEICIDIIDDCQAADQFVADNIRELEDGNYRLLE